VKICEVNVCGSGEGPVAGSCEHDSESSGFAVTIHHIPLCGECNLTVVGVFRLLGSKFTLKYTQLCHSMWSLFIPSRKQEKRWKHI